MPPKRVGVVLREKVNWLIHHQYVRQDYDICLKTIEEHLKECQGLSEYPIYVKALIKRQRGEIAESLQLFQAATCLNPRNVSNLKQVHGVVSGHRSRQVDAGSPFVHAKAVPLASELESLR